MRISYNWLKDYIDLTESPEEIARLLTHSGLEVEKVEAYESIKGGLVGIVIGKVLTCEQHPNADRLRKTTVDVGAETPLNIVCGAPNVAVGQTVVVATIGATMYPSEGEPFKIQKSKIRGEVSEGMLCAEDELGMGKSHDGIIVIEKDIAAGTSAQSYFNVEVDSIFEIGLTPNRADAASHLGVARDLRALLNRNLKKVDLKNFQPGFKASGINLKVENTKACPRYTGLTITGVKIGESPEWIKTRLRSIGLNPINNVVDITNYVMHSLGQPLHAYDLDEIKGHTVVVKNLPAGTEFITLDGEKRKLLESDLMVCNATEPMCMAGVYGGLESGVQKNTRHIFLECAYFNPEIIRTTSMKHGLKTDSSFRFERGTDPNMPKVALRKAAAMIVEIAGGEISADILDSQTETFPPFRIETTHQRICKVIGKEIPADRILEIISLLDIKLAFRNGDLLVLDIPPFRVDVQREADLVEEILRIYGYDNIELSDRLSTEFLAEFPTKDTDKIHSLVDQTLIAKGFQEILTNSLTKAAYVDLLSAQTDAVSILNKLSEELAFMRPSLSFTGLESIAYNINRRQKNLKFFEWGKTYSKRANKYLENNKLAVFLTGNQHTESWNMASKAVDFFDLKSVVVQILEKLNISVTQVQEIESNPIFSKGVIYKHGGKVLVEMGYVSKALLKATDIKQDVLFADFDADLLLELYSNTSKYSEISKFPEVRRDLSLVLDASVTFEHIKELALKTERKILSDINVFDVYDGKHIESGKKSYSISFTLLDKEQTLTDQAIDSTMNKLMQVFEKELNTTIRK
ncbi:phenylalanine--tRNA ligase subunit beta [uncultured Cytophaga sp.]|uniref:phenylalanine--tRNA ligase subunit beta n=1 Tax=uncultured Cytophaga sp. TaxID=160238 RepID=UPI0026174AFB|nr:phenylalanine--tRNA ligase subunit beta [uncultured Cytophaga sp.]